MSDTDREWQEEPGLWDEGAREDADLASEEPSYLEERHVVRATERHGDGDARSEHDKWRRWAWAALVVLFIGVAWALTLSTILLDRSGDNTAELIALVEEGHRNTDLQRTLERNTDLLRTLDEAPVPGSL